ncbi:serine protease Do [Abditibacterium utsteinense]|uniref:Serine protease Do n=1 Tax=Abditibacterium utsteinense TaxID=1960156 RepID=A0A2S8SRC0_9BACT|nr:trypsin-like peptidase domain-containing protein [Abditibacterium utsteinense]PQV63353.1 serine protease Do [Abditibacterium utsteinense]
MRARFLPLFLIAPFLIADFTPAAAQTQAPPVATAAAVQEAFVRVAEKLRPSVVTIICENSAKVGATTKPDDRILPPDNDEDAPFSDPSEPSSSLGTGVVIRADGYLLTNYHVVRDADVIRVLFNADLENPDRAVAQLVGFDEESDLAVLKIARQDLSAAIFADSDQVRIGQWALAMGAPFDQPQTFTAGVISAKGRHLDKKGRVGLQDFLQTDASINPGNSGGPLVNLAGEVIGINTAILSPSRFNVGIGFSVPSNTISRLMPILLSGKSVQRGFLGIQYVRIDDDVAKEFGVAGGMQIGALAKKDGNTIGPAKAAGLREDDIITAVDGEAITSSDQFRVLVASAPPGKVLKLAVTRPGETTATHFDTQITLGDRALQLDDAKAAPARPTKTAAMGLGLETKNSDKLTPLEKSRFSLAGKEKGAVITQITPGSPADEADLGRGLRIVRARIEGVWHLIPDAITWQKIEKEAAPKAHILVQLRDKDEVSVYKVLIVPEKTAA